MSTAPGRLIALEGIDGCGKSTQAQRLARHLGAELTHEPGGTALGRAIRPLLLLDSDDAPVARAEALLLAADRAQHVTTMLLPALGAGRWVVTDRFSGSTLAYQGSGRGLGGPDLDRVVRWAAGGLDPDLTVLLDVPLDVARTRLSGSPDRLERMDDAFFVRVREEYLRLARAQPEQWGVVDGAACADEVHASILGLVEDRLRPLPSPAPS